MITNVNKSNNYNSVDGTVKQFQELPLQSLIAHSNPFNRCIDCFTQNNLHLRELEFRRKQSVPPSQQQQQQQQQHLKASHVMELYFLNIISTITAH